MWLLLVAVALHAPNQKKEHDKTQVTRIYLLRHAEKAKASGDDPPLTENGMRRAQALASLLGNEKIEAVMATRYRRTRETVTPLAEALGLEVEVVRDNPMVLSKTLSKKLRGKTVLFAGHSDTLPLLLKALGCKERVVIRQRDYGDLFVLELGGRGKPRLTKRRYGD